MGAGNQYLTRAGCERSWLNPKAFFYLTLSARVCCLGFARIFLIPHMLLLDYAWKHFSVIADQRIKTFN
jgi:hypothetical protein